MSQNQLSLRRRIIASFLAMTTAACLLFGFFSFLFAYVIEDSLFDDALSEEMAHQKAHWRQYGQLDRPARDYVELYRDPAAFPPDLRGQYGAESGRGEFSGDSGRHYHVRKFALPGSGGTAYIVAEVSGHLVVRPIREEMLVFLVLWMAGLLLATGLLGYWLANRATEPLTRLAGILSGTAADQIPRVSAEAFPANEIGLLAATLERAFDRIRAFVERESRFTRDASHELRTPLAVIRSAAELIEAQRNLPLEVSRPMRRISEAAREMERTIDLLLLLAREENSTPQPENVPLLPLVETAVLRASERFDGADQNVCIVVAEDRIIWVNLTAAAIVLDNLIGNAFQHSRCGKISIQAQGDELVIADTGPGIPDSVSGMIYQPFAKGEESAGHGLGLSIVRRLCDRNDIDFTLECSACGGTTIRLGFRAGSASGDAMPTPGMERQ